MRELCAESINAHYGRAGLLDAVLAELRALGLEPAAVTLEALAPLDHFHGGGLAATLDLARLAGPLAGQRVLDAGGGLGGPARILAAQFGCSVTVVELTAAFCQVGEVLTALTGLDRKISFLQADAAALPFPPGSFEVVWAQNSLMNIAGKEALYAGFRRVLRPGGTFAFQEVMAGPAQPIHYPVPWADDPGLSHLQTSAEARALLRRLGFAEVLWADTSSTALAALHQPAASQAPRTLPHLSRLLRSEEDAQRVAGNLAKNLEEGRVAYVQGVFRTPG